jgi:hypothetical protein
MDQPKTDEQWMIWCGASTAGKRMPAMILSTIAGMILIFAASISASLAQDKAAPSPPVPSKLASAGPVMAVDDFVARKRILVGKLVAVTGSAYCDDRGLCHLSSSETPMINVSFATSRLDQDDREHLRQCDPFSNPCEVTISGEVTARSSSLLNADAIAFAPTDEDLAAADPSLPPCNQVSSVDIQELAESSPVARILDFKAIGSKIEAKTDAKGHMHCVAHVLSKAGEKILTYHLKRIGDQILIVGTWR